MHTDHPHHPLVGGRGGVSDAYWLARRHSDELSIEAQGRFDVGGALRATRASRSGAARARVISPHGVATQWQLAARAVVRLHRGVVIPCTTAW